MLDRSKIVVFSATVDAEESIRFYRDVLKLRLVADEPFALVFDANGTTLRIQKVQSVVTVPYTTLGWDVDDLAATMSLLANAGVEPERFSGLNQDNQGIAQFPGGAMVAWFKDPDGNLLSVAQMP